MLCHSQHQLTTGRILSSIFSNPLPLLLSFHPQLILIFYKSISSPFSTASPFTPFHWKSLSQPKFLSPASPHPRAVGPRLSWAAKRGPPAAAASRAEHLLQEILPARHPPHCHRFSSFGTGLNRLHYYALHWLEESSVVEQVEDNVWWGEEGGGARLHSSDPQPSKRHPRAAPNQLTESAKRGPTGRVGCIPKTHDCQQSPTGRCGPTNKEPQATAFLRLSTESKYEKEVRGAETGWEEVSRRTHELTPFQLNAQAQT